MPSCAYWETKDSFFPDSQCDAASCPGYSIKEIDICGIENYSDYAGHDTNEKIPPYEGSEWDAPEEEFSDEAAKMSDMDETN
jgi:hypothetical protein